MNNIFIFYIKSNMSIVLSPSGTGKTTWLNNTNTIFEDADVVLNINIIIVILKEKITQKI